MCTWTCGGSETSLNTVVYANVKVYEPVCVFFWNFLKFFQKLPSAYIFINCTNLSKLVKFVKIVLDTYLNFIKLLNISKIFWKVNTKFWVFCIYKIYTNSFIIYPSFSNIFSIILKCPRSLSKYSSNFFFFKISTNITQN